MAGGMRILASAAAMAAICAVLPAFAADDQAVADAAYAQRMFPAALGKPKNYACFVRT